MQPARNYRPPLKTRLRHGLFWGCGYDMPRWRTVVVVIALAVAYPTASYIDELGNRKAAEAENVKLKERIRWHAACMTDRYATGKVPSYTPRGKQDASKKN